MSRLNSSLHQCTSHKLVADSSTFHNRAAHRERASSGIKEYTGTGQAVAVDVGVYDCLNRENNFCGHHNSSLPFTDAVCHGRCTMKSR